MRHLMPLLVLCYALIPGITSATTWVVLPDSTGDAPTIQAGIDSSSAGDTVMVMSGIYREHDISIKSGVYLTSETGTAECVTIDADSLGRIFYCDQADSNTHMVGFTAINGRADRGGGMYFNTSDARVTDCCFRYNCICDTCLEIRGGGVYLDHGSPVFTDCDFSYNSVTDAGMPAHAYDGDGGGVTARWDSPTFINCTFSHNSVVCMTSSSGGGFSCSGSCSPTFIDCLFDSNTAGGANILGDADAVFSNCTFRGNSAAPGMVAGGMACLSDDAIITGCLFEGNSSSQGGGLVCRRSYPTVTDCRFFDNNGGYMGGGALVEYYCSPTFSHCVFAGNSASNGGGVGVKDDSFLQMISCTFSANSSGNLGGGVFCGEESSVSADNCIIAFSQDGRALYWDGTGTEPVLTCCDLYGNADGDWVGPIADQYGVNGNISEDPLFCDPENDDYHLHEDSPCAPAQQPVCGLIGAFDAGCYSGIPDRRDPSVPKEALLSVWPNPFRDGPSILYEIPGGPGTYLPVLLRVYDAAGRHVRTLVESPQPAGRHVTDWDGLDAEGRALEPGIYFCRMQAGDKVLTCKIVIVR
jgi:hypothetical protein